MGNFLLKSLAIVRGRWHEAVRIGFAQAKASRPDPIDYAS